MKELFSRTFKYFKRDISVWILGIIIYALIMTICISLSLLIGIFDILAIFFVSMPFLISFILIIHFPRQLSSPASIPDAHAH